METHAGSGDDQEGGLTPVQDKRLRWLAWTGDFWTGPSGGENGMVFMTCGDLEKLQPIADDLNGSIITERIKNDNYRIAYRPEDEEKYVRYIKHLYDTRQVPIMRPNRYAWLTESIQAMENKRAYNKYR